MQFPNPLGTRKCIQSAIENAGIHPDQIDLINGHLTATFADPHEVMAWQSVLKRAPHKFPLINSTKSLIGHALGAAGAIEIVASVLELHHQFVHPSLNCEDLHPELELIAGQVPHQALAQHPIQIVAKASFGFGDVNGCIILKQWNP